MSGSSDSDGESGNTEAETPRRTTPLTPREKSLLIDLVTKNRSILENKRTNGEWVTKRQETWERIAWEFNSERHTTKRTAQQLKKCWENSKRLAKKDAKKYLNDTKTSDSGSPLHEIPTDMLHVMYVDPAQVASLPNDFDCATSYDGGPSAEANILDESQEDCEDLKPMDRLNPAVLPIASFHPDHEHCQAVVPEEIMEREREQHQVKMDILHLQLKYEKRKRSMLEEEHRKKMRLLDAQIAAAERVVQTDCS